MTDRRSVAANTKVPGVFANQFHEIVKFRRARVRINACAAAVGLNVTALVGETTVISDQEVNAQNRMPIYPDDYLAEYVAVQGQKIQVDWRNTTGAAIVGFLKIDIDPF